MGPDLLLPTVGRVAVVVLAWVWQCTSRTRRRAGVWRGGGRRALLPGAPRRACHDVYARRGTVKGKLDGGPSRSMVSLGYQRLAASSSRPLAHRSQLPPQPIRELAYDPAALVAHGTSRPRIAELALCTA